MEGGREASGTTSWWWRESKRTELEEQHNNSLESCAKEKEGEISIEPRQAPSKLLTDSTTGVRGRTKAESIHVVLHVDGVNVDGAHALLEEVGVVQTLSSTEDLLAAHEEVVGVGEALRRSTWSALRWRQENEGTNGVGGIGHGVEGAEGEGELVDDVVVGVVLLLDEAAEGLLSRGAAGRETSAELHSEGFQAHLMSSSSPMGARGVPCSTPASWRILIASE